MLVKDIYHENFCLFFDMHSAVVNQGAETLWGDGKNHDHERGVLHDHEKRGKPLKNKVFYTFYII